MRRGIPCVGANASSSSEYTLTTASSEDMDQVDSDPVPVCKRPERDGGTTRVKRHTLDS